MPNNRDIISVASTGGQLTTITRDKLPSWEELLPDQLADCDKYGVPDLYVSKEVGSAGWRPAALAKIPPGAAEAVDPDARRALDRLKFRVRLAGIYGLSNEELGARIVTVVRSGAHRQVVLCEVADAAHEANENYEWADCYDHAAEVWGETVRPHEEVDDENVPVIKPCRAMFDADDYGSMANHAHDFILRQLRVKTLTAIGEKLFVTERGPVPLDIIDPIIRKSLDCSDLRDADDPLATAMPNSRTIAEVRRAMAMKWPHVGVVDAPAGSAAAVRGSGVTAMIADGGPHSFASDKLELGEDHWIDSDALWAAWVEWCANRLPPREPGDRSNTMGKLSRALGLKRGKHRSGGEPQAGYQGAKLRG